MMELSVDERVELDRRVALAMHRLNEKDNVRDALADIYCEFLPDKERWQGEMMADKLISSILSFKEQCATADDSLETYMSVRLEEMVRDMDQESACKALGTLVESLRALDSGTVTACFSSSEPEKAMEELVRNVEEREYQGPYDLASRNALMKEARRLISKANLTSWLIEDLGREENGGAARLVLEGRMREDTLTAVTSMVLYTMAAEDGVGSQGRPVTLEEAAVAVCSREYIEQICRDYRGGLISLQRYEKLMAVAEAVTILSIWILECAGTLATIYLAAKNAGIITAVLTAILMIRSFAELNELIEESVSKVTSKLAMNMYRKSLMKQIKKSMRDDPAASDAVKAGEQADATGGCREETGYSGLGDSDIEGLNGDIYDDRPIILDGGME